MDFTLIVIFSVLTTILAIMAAFFFYLFRKSEKEKMTLQKKYEASSNTKKEAGEQEKEEEKEEPTKKDFFDMFSFDCRDMVKRQRKARKEGWTYRGKPYSLLDCPAGSIYKKNNKWINENATHNTKHIKEVTKRENAVIVGMCNMTVPSPKGTRFVIEDLYGRITTEPAKFKPEISANELQNRLVVFKGYIENERFIVKRVIVTKFETKSIFSA